MNKAQLVEAVAQNCDLSKAKAEQAIKSTFETISNELNDGGSVQLIGFGTFSVGERSARTGINPKTKETIQIAAKKVAKFKPGKQLSESVNS
ncbi:MAG: HU family DNA-binding protein [Candidatus Kapaibacteriales bacterium]